MKIDIARIKALQNGTAPLVYNPLSSNSDCNLIMAIQEWAQTKDNFDTEFIDSIEKFYQRTGHITSNQREALENIATKFHIEIEDYL